MQQNKIYNENCLNTMSIITNNTIDLVVTSPPYDNLRKYNNYTFDFNAIAQELYRIIAIGGVIVWVVGDSVMNGSESCTSFKQALFFNKIGFKLHDTMIFEKNSSTFPAKKTGNRYTQIFEYMFIFSKGKPKTANLICDKANKWAGHKDFSGKLKNPVPEFSARTNIWKYTTSFNGYKHPAPFPIKLAEDHILCWSNENNVVYDPFMGSGTTAIAALKHNRHFIGSEISKDYCLIANNRIQNFYDKQ